MRFTHDPAAPGHDNMARDRELLLHAEAGYGHVRLYTWDGPWVSLGRFQKPERDLLQESSVPWVQRPTGGKAVLHGHDQTVTVAVPLESLNADPRSIKSVYRALIQPLVVAMQSVGLPCALAEETRFCGKGVRTADCFAFSSANDIVHSETGRKVCGCALRITETAVLMQASIPYREPLVSAQTVVVGGASLSSHPWRFEEFAESLRNAYSGSTGCGFR